MRAPLMVVPPGIHYIHTHVPVGGHRPILHSLARQQSSGNYFIANSGCRGVGVTDVVKALVHHVGIATVGFESRQQQ